MRHNRGVVSIFAVFGLLVMAVAVPVVASLVKTSTENRSKATTNCLGSIVCTGGVLGSCVAEGNSCTSRCPHGTSKIAGSCSVAISPTQTPCARVGETIYAGKSCCSGLVPANCTGSGSTQICKCVAVAVTPTVPVGCPGGSTCAVSCVGGAVVRDFGSCRFGINNASGYCCDFSVGNCGQLTNRKNNCGCDSNIQCASGTCANRKCVATVVPTTVPVGCPGGSTCAVSCVGGAVVRDFGSCRFGINNASGYCCDFSVGNCGQLTNRKNNCGCDSNIQCASGSCVRNRCVTASVPTVVCKTKCVNTLGFKSCDGGKTWVYSSSIKCGGSNLRLEVE